VTTFETFFWLIVICIVIAAYVRFLKDEWLNIIPSVSKTQKSVKVELATIPSRLGGAFIDFLIVIILVVVIMFIWGLILGLQGSENYDSIEASNTLWQGRGILVGLATDLVYTVAMHSSKANATFGQKAVGIKIANENGSTISLGKVLLRYFVSLISSILLKLGFAIALFTKNKKTLHELASGTIVIKDSPEETQVIHNNENSVEVSSPSYELNIKNNTPIRLKEASMEDAYRQANTPQVKFAKDSMEDAYQNTLPTRSVSAIELNFTIANQNAPKPSINSDVIWAEIYKEFESAERNLGLWARLFAQHEGNETKAKAEYLKIRFDSKLEELERAASTSQDAAKTFERKDYVNKTEETCIKDNVFDLYTSSGYEIYVFPNGNAAYKRFKVYKVYESKDAAINAIKIYLRTEVVGRTGFIRDFREEDL